MAERGILSSTNNLLCVLVIALVTWYCHCVFAFLSLPPYIRHRSPPRAVSGTFHSARSAPDRCAINIVAFMTEAKAWHTSLEIRSKRKTIQQVSVVAFVIYKTLTRPHPAKGSTNTGISYLRAFSFYLKLGIICAFRYPNIYQMLSWC